MKFSSKENIEVPVEQVFEMLTDFERHERSAMRRGAEVSRIDNQKEPGTGATWTITFGFRGKERNLRLELTEFDRPHELTFHADMGGLESDVNVQLVALSKTRTRINVNAEMSAKTLSARLLVQSFKLAKSNISKRFDTRLAAQARDMEDRYSRMA